MAKIVAAMSSIGLIFGVSHLPELVAAIVFLSVMAAIAIIALVNHAIQWHKRGEELKAWALMELAKDEAKVKEVAKEEFKDTGDQIGWNRNNEHESQYLAGTFSDCYFVYETLIGRTGYERKYPAFMRDALLA